MGRWRDLFAAPLDPARRLFTTHAMLAVQVPADPGLDPLPVSDHEQMADAGQGQGDVQRQPGSSRTEQETVMPGGDHVCADGDGRVDQLPKDAVPHLPAHHAPERP